MRFKDFHINVKVLMTESFMSGFLGNMIFPFMAIYLSVQIGAKNAGIVLFLNVIFGILTGFLGGYLGDQVGRKKIMIYGETIRFLSVFIMMVFNSPWFDSISITIVMFMINTMCWGFTSPVNNAMLIDTTKPHERKYMYSISYWVTNLSIALGGLIGGFLFYTYFFELLIGLTVGAFASVILVTFFLKDNLTVKKTSRTSLNYKDFLISYEFVLKDKLFMLFFIAGVLIVSAEFQLTNYIAIRMGEDFPTQNLLGWSFDGVNVLGILRAESALLIVVLSLFIMKFVNKFKDSTILIIGSFVYSTSYGVISYIDNLVLLLIFMLFATAGELIRMPVQQSMLAALPPENLRSSYMAIDSLSTNIARIICAITVTISAFLPPFYISLLITFFGLTGVYIYYLIIKTIQLRISVNQM